MRRAKIERRKEARSLKEHSPLLSSLPLYPPPPQQLMTACVLRATLMPAARNACAVAESLSTDTANLHKFAL
ncbi:hypothetical protein DdX_03794 [Ditylenchus destructor]|uniref:Uncharacterized protein n=1 Tax=Ditylenchus destructor TaxID=166010 RepID=A0AAD4NAR0_9BILA|nr:hypothetical protein DdX_03794 [Ditylenchus destructor]